MIYGYCRISTAKQNISRQVRNIMEGHPTAVIVSETYTGTTADRKEWSKLVSAVGAGDTIVFDSVSRMSRNADEGYLAYEDLYRRGVELVFLREPHINTAVYRQALQNSVPMTGGAVDLILHGVNRYLMELAREQIRLAFVQAEKEVEDLRRRTSEGIQTARLNGKQVGQPKGATWETAKGKRAKEVIRKHCKAFGGHLSDGEVIQLAGISRNSFYKYKSQLREALA